MKHQVFIAKNALSAIQKCVTKANGNYEVGGVLVGYHFGSLHRITAATTSDIDENPSKVSFILNGTKHSQKVNEIISNSIFSPTVLGIWHSHICDGHTFSAQDIRSNKTLAKQFDGILSMLITAHNYDLTLSVAHITSSGDEEKCKLHLRKRDDRTKPL